MCVHKLLKTAMQQSHDSTVELLNRCQTNDKIRRFLGQFLSSAKIGHTTQNWTSLSQADFLSQNSNVSIFIDKLSQFW